MNSIRGGNLKLNLTQVTRFKQCIQWDYGELFRWICLSLCKRILSSQQPDVCRAIPLHNYLRTSGTCKHSERASSSSVSFSLSLIVSSSLSTLSGLFLPTTFLLVFRVQSFLFPSLFHRASMYTFISLFLPLLLYSSHA